MLGVFSMRKFYILITVLMLAGCATGKNDPKTLVTLLSYEKYTDLYVNGELAGINHTQTMLPYKGIKETTLEGRKKGCQSVTLKPEYEFDSPMILNPLNLLYVPEKYFALDFWRPAKKNIYNLTPICEN